MDGNEPENIWSLFHLRKLAFDTKVESLAAWVTISIGALLFAFIVCTFIGAALLVRLGWDALSAATPAYQEAARNFLLAFAWSFWSAVSHLEIVDRSQTSRRGDGTSARGA